jgi:tryptophan-rich sensory protein
VRRDFCSAAAALCERARRRLAGAGAAADHVEARATILTQEEKEIDECCFIRGWPSFRQQLTLHTLRAKKNTKKTRRYKTLDKPSWTPPNKLFGPAWGVLYVCMGTANWLVLQAKGAAGRKTALALYGAQLLLNFAYTPLLFSAKWLDAALLDITGACCVCCVCFVRVLCVCVRGGRRLR